MDRFLGAVVRREYVLSCSRGGHDGVEGASGVKLTLSLEHMNKGCSPYGKALTEETLLWWLLKNMSHGGCLLLKQDDFIKTVLTNYQ